MFFIEKLISLTLLSPLPIIVILFLIGVTIFKKYKKSSLFLIATSIFLYVASTDFFIDKPLYNLEKDYTFSTEEEIKNANIYVLLGGGIFTNTANGNIPTLSAYSRILHTAQLYHQYPKKIFISGGSPLQNVASESSVYKRELVELGINPDDIIIEENSKTTFENAKFINNILEKNKQSSMVLITSASHMKRSLYIFKKVMKDSTSIYPAPCGFLGSEKGNNIFYYLPQYSNFYKFNILLWETIGNFYYKFK